MVMLFFLLYLSFTIPTVYSAKSKEKPIESAPYSVSFLYGGKHYCSGSYVDNQWVITAALCIVIKRIKKTEVRMGGAAWDTGGEVRHIKKVIQHPLKAPIKPNATASNASVEVLNNIGLVKLKEPFTLGNSIKTIEMKLEHQNYKGSKVEVIGYGRLCDKDATSKTLDSFTFNVARDDDYVLFPPWDLERKPAVGCHGDSGGPIVAGGKLVGVVVCGNDCGPKQSLLDTAFLKISPHSVWIKKKIAENEQEPCAVPRKSLLVILFSVILLLK